MVEIEYDAGDASAPSSASRTAQGTSVERWGTKTEPTVGGRSGDRTDSARFPVAPNLYLIQSVSRCFPGDPDEP
jgi:hypothetical protein